MECDLRPYEVDWLLDAIGQFGDRMHEVPMGLAKLYDLLQADCATIHLNKVK